MRTKLVNFRLSDDEASYLIEQANASGARSVSEYVRVTSLEVASRHMQRRDAVQAIGQDLASGINREDSAALRLVFVLRALEEALRDARRGIVKY